MQSRWMSLVEAVTNIVVGYGLAVLTQIAVFPLFGLQVALRETFLLGGDVPVDVEIRSEVGVALLEP